MADSTLRVILFVRHKAEQPLPMVAAWWTASEKIDGWHTTRPTCYCFARIMGKMPMLRLIVMEDFFHVGPPFAFGSGVEGLLAGFADVPPFLGGGVGGHR
jgi:hypothetical protein